MPERYVTKLSDLMQKYQEALREKNIEKALLAGEAYFTTFRNGELLEEDREKIQNDILLMVTQNG